MNSFANHRHDNLNVLEALIDRVEHTDRGKRTLGKAVRDVLLRGAATVGEGYFSAVVQDIAKVLGASLVLIGELDDEGLGVDIIAVCEDGKLTDGLSYDLRDTPCAEVLGGGCCMYPSRVTASFPKDRLLAKMGAEGYVGAPLPGSDGRPVGVLVALFREPVADPEFAFTLMLIFAARTAAELERVAREREARALEAKVLQAQRLESLGVLAGGLAHDFNNLLASMLGSADLATHKLPAEHPALEHLELIGETAADAGGLCRELLAYAGKGRFEVVKTPLSSIVSEQEKLLRASVAKDATLLLELADDTPTCSTDVSQIKQVLLNLVLNASEALTAGKGTIRVSTGLCSVDSEGIASEGIASEGIASDPTPLPLRPGPYAFLKVADTGSGMTPEVKAKLFDPFFTTKFTGRGLGLAAILGIVKGHEGSIQVHSEPGLGSCFTILLPACTEDLAAPREPREQTGWRGSGLALIVDDDPRVALVTADMLELLGFESLVAEGGVQALEIFREHSDRLAVVVLDLTMPGMSGAQVFQEMHELNDSVPVILSSGFDEQDTTQDIACQGLAGFLPKPFRMKALRECLRAAIEAHPR